MNVVTSDFSNNKTIFIDIEYNINKINYNGIMGGEIKDVIKNLKDVINTQIISKNTEFGYYIQGEYDDYMPSPFSHSNSLDYIIPSILYNIVTYNKKKIIFKICFFSTSKQFNFFDINKYPIYDIEIINLNKS